MVSIRQGCYKKFKECVIIEANQKKLIVTTSLGPRIIFYGKDDVNIFHEDDLDSIHVGGEFFDKNLPGLGIWHLYGGHRLWKAPEYMDTYYPDNKRVDFKILKDNEVLFISDKEITTGLRKSILIKMDDMGDVVVEQKIENVDGKIQTPIAAWGITVLDKSAKVEIELPKEDTGFLPNKNVAYWSYTKINDERINLSTEYLKIEQKGVSEPLKVGTYSLSGVEANVKGMSFSIKTDKIEGTYPDLNCNVECYVKDYVEVEMLSPLQIVAKGESLVHKEYWTLR